MIDFGIKYQLTVFGHFEEITPEPKIISKILDLFASYPLIPGTFNQFIVGSNAVNQKLKLGNQNGDLNVFFSGDRIDIEKTPSQNVNDKLEYLEFIEQGKDIITRVLKTFGKKANRIAVVDNYLFKELSDEKINKVFSNVFNLKNKIKTKPKIEWNFRIANRDVFDFSNSKEEINMILSLNLLKSQIPHNNILIDTHNKLLLNIDINTIPENMEDRFEIEEIIFFITNILSYKDKWVNDFINQIK